MSDDNIEKHAKNIRRGTRVVAFGLALLALAALGYKEIFFATAEQADGYVSSLRQFGRSRRISAEESVDIFFNCTLKLQLYCDTYKVAFGYEHPVSGIKTFPYPGLIIGTEQEVRDMNVVIYFNPNNPGEAAIRNISTEFATSFYLAVLSIGIYLGGQTVVKNLHKRVKVSSRIATTVAI